MEKDSFAHKLRKLFEDRAIRIYVVGIYLLISQFTWFSTLHLMNLINLILTCCRKLFRILHYDAVPECIMMPILIAL